MSTVTVKLDHRVADEFQMPTNFTKMARPFMDPSDPVTRTSYQMESMRKI